MPHTKVRVGLIGFGHMHVNDVMRRFNEVPGVQWVAAADTVADPPETTVEVGAFGIAGGLVQLLTAPVAILVDAASFVVSSGTLLLIRTPEPLPRPAGERQSAWQEMREGLDLVARHPILRALAAAELTNQVFVQIWVAMLLLFRIRELQFEPTSSDDLQRSASFFATSRSRLGD